MKFLTMLATALLLAGCGGDSPGPSQTFTGTWAGNAYPSESDTVRFEVTATQSGSTVSGIGTYVRDATTYGSTVSGISTPPNLSLTITINAQTLSFVGAYVTSDSVAGTITLGMISLPLSLKKQ